MFSCSNQGFETGNGARKADFKAKRLKVVPKRMISAGSPKGTSE